MAFSPGNCNSVVSMVSKIPETVNFRENVLHVYGIIVIGSLLDPR